MAKNEKKNNILNNLVDLEDAKVNLQDRETLASLNSFINTSFNNIIKLCEEYNIPTALFGEMVSIFRSLDIVRDDKPESMLEVLNGKLSLCYSMSAMLRNQITNADADGFGVAAAQRINRKLEAIVNETLASPASMFLKAGKDTRISDEALPEGARKYTNKDAINQRKAQIDKLKRLTAPFLKKATQPTESDKDYGLDQLALYVGSTLLSASKQLNTKEAELNANNLGDSKYDPRAFVGVDKALEAVSTAYSSVGKIYQKAVTAAEKQLSDTNAILVSKKLRGTKLEGRKLFSGEAITKEQSEQNADLAELSKVKSIQKRSSKNPIISKVKTSNDVDSLNSIVEQFFDNEPLITIEKDYSTIVKDIVSELSGETIEFDSGEDQMDIDRESFNIDQMIQLRESLISRSEESIRADAEAIRDGIDYISSIEKTDGTAIVDLTAYANTKKKAMPSMIDSVVKDFRSSNVNGKPETVENILDFIRTEEPIFTPIREDLEALANGRAKKLSLKEYTEFYANKLQETFGGEKGKAAALGFRRIVQRFNDTKGKAPATIENFIEFLKKDPKYASILKNATRYVDRINRAYSVDNYKNRLTKSGPDGVKKYKATVKLQRKMKASDIPHQSIADANKYVEEKVKSRQYTKNIARDYLKVQNNAQADLYYNTVSEPIDTVLYKGLEQLDHEKNDDKPVYQKVVKQEISKTIDSISKTMESLATFDDKELANPNSDGIVAEIAAQEAREERVQENGKLRSEFATNKTRNAFYKRNLQPYEQTTTKKYKLIERLISEYKDDAQTKAVLETEKERLEGVIYKKNSSLSLLKRRTKENAAKSWERKVNAFRNSEAYKNAKPEDQKLYGSLDTYIADLKEAISVNSYSDASAIMKMLSDEYSSAIKMAGYEDKIPDIDTATYLSGDVSEKEKQFRIEELKANLTSPTAVMALIKESLGEDATWEDIQGFIGFLQNPELKLNKSEKGHIRAAFNRLQRQYNRKNQDIGPIEQKAIRNKADTTLHDYEDMSAESFFENLPPDQKEELSKNYDILKTAIDKGNSAQIKTANKTLSSNISTVKEINDDPKKKKSIEAENAYNNTLKGINAGALTDDYQTAAKNNLEVRKQAVMKFLVAKYGEGFTKEDAAGDTFVTEKKKEIEKIQTLINRAGDSNYKVSWKQAYDMSSNYSAKQAENLLISENKTPEQLEAEKESSAKAAQEVDINKIKAAFEKPSVDEANLSYKEYVKAALKQKTLQYKKYIEAKYAGNVTDEQFASDEWLQHSKKELNAYGKYIEYASNQEDVGNKNVWKTLSSIVANPIDFGSKKILSLNEDMQSYEDKQSSAQSQKSPEEIAELTKTLRTRYNDDISAANSLIKTKNLPTAYKDLINKRMKALKEASRGTSQEDYYNAKNYLDNAVKYSSKFNVKQPEVKDWSKDSRVAKKLNANIAQKKAQEEADKSRKEEEKKQKQALTKTLQTRYSDDISEAKSLIATKNLPKKFEELLKKRIGALKEASNGTSQEDYYDAKNNLDNVVKYASKFNVKQPEVKDWSKDSRVNKRLEANKAKKKAQDEDYKNRLREANSTKTQAYGPTINVGKETSRLKRIQEYSNLQTEFNEEFSDEDRQNYQELFATANRQLANLADNVDYEASYNDAKGKFKTSRINIINAKKEAAAKLDRKSVVSEIKGNYNNEFTDGIRKANPELFKRADSSLKKLEDSAETGKDFKALKNDVKAEITIVRRELKALQTKQENAQKEAKKAEIAKQKQEEAEAKTLKDKENRKSSFDIANKYKEAELTKEIREKYANDVARIEGNFKVFEDSIETGTDFKSYRTEANKSLETLLNKVEKDRKKAVSSDRVARLFNNLPAITGNEFKTPEEYEKDLKSQVDAAFDGNVLSDAAQQLFNARVSEFENMQKNGEVTLKSRSALAKAIGKNYSNLVTTEDNPQVKTGDELNEALPKTVEGLKDLIAVLDKIEAPSDNTSEFSKTTFDNGLNQIKEVVKAAIPTTEKAAIAKFNEDRLNKSFNASGLGTKDNAIANIANLQEALDTYTKTIYGDNLTDEQRQSDDIIRETEAQIAKLKELADLADKGVVRWRDVQKQSASFDAVRANQLSGEGYDKLDILTAPKDETQKAKDVFEKDFESLEDIIDPKEYREFLKELVTNPVAIAQDDSPEIKAKKEVAKAQIMQSPEYQRIQKRYNTLTGKSVDENVTEEELNALTNALREGSIRANNYGVAGFLSKYRLDKEKKDRADKTSATAGRLKELNTTGSEFDISEYQERINEELSAIDNSFDKQYKETIQQSNEYKKLADKQAAITKALAYGGKYADYIANSIKNGTISATANTVAEEVKAAKIKDQTLGNTYERRLTEMNKVSRYARRYKVDLNAEPGSGKDYTPNYNYKSTVEEKLRKFNEARDNGDLREAETILREISLDLDRCNEKINSAKQKALGVSEAFNTVGNAVSSAMQSVVNSINSCIRRIEVFARTTVQVLKQGINTVRRLVHLFGNLGNRVRGTARSNSVLSRSYMELNAKISILERAYRYLTSNRLVEQAQAVYSGIASLAVISSSTSQEIVRFADTLEQKLGTSADNVVSSVAEVSATIYGLGIKAKNIASVSSNLVMAGQAMARLGLGGGKYEVVMGKITSGMRGMTQAIDDLGISVREKKLASLLKEVKKAPTAYGLTAEKVANLTDKYENLTEEQRVTLRTFSVLDQFTKNYGNSVELMSKYMDTAIGRMSNLREAAKSLATTVGKVLYVAFAKIAPLVEYIIRRITKAITDFANFKGIFIDNNKAIEEYTAALSKSKNAVDEETEAEEENTNAKENNSLASFDKITNLSDSGGESEKVDLSDMLNSLPDLQSQLDSMQDNYFVKLNAHIEKLKTKLKEHIQSFFNRKIDFSFGFDKTSGWASIKAIEARVESIFKSIRDTILTAFTGIADATKAGAILNKLLQLTLNVASLISNVTRGIKRIVTEAMNDPVVIARLREIGERISGLLDTAIGKVRRLNAFLIDNLDLVIKAILGDAEAATELADKLANHKGLQYVIDFLSKTREMLNQALETLKVVAKEVLGPVLEDLLVFLKDTVLPYITEQLKWIATYVQEHKEKIIKFLKAAKELLWQLLKFKWETAKNFITFFVSSGLGTKIAEILKKVLEFKGWFPGFITVGVIGLLGKSIGTISRVSKTIKDVINAIGILKEVGVFTKITNGFKLIGTVAKSVGGGISTVFQTVGSTALSVVKTVAIGIKTWLTTSVSFVTLSTAQMTVVILAVAAVVIELIILIKKAIDLSKETEKLKAKDPVGVIDKQYNDRVSNINKAYDAKRISSTQRDAALKKAKTARDNATSNAETAMNPGLFGRKYFGYKEKDESFSYGFDIAGLAKGGLITSRVVTQVGEDGPEMVIPLGADKRNRGVSLWKDAASYLGISNLKAKVSDKTSIKSIPNIAAYSNGGVFRNGQLFIGNEKGAELIGNFGDTNGVANNQMIIQSMKEAVYEAVYNALAQFIHDNPDKELPDAPIINVNGPTLLNNKQAIMELARVLFPYLKATDKLSSNLSYKMT